MGIAADIAIIVMAGLAGALVARWLRQPLVIVDNDYRRVERLKDLGYSVIYGDAKREAVLEAAAVKNTCLVIVTTPSAVATQAIIDRVRDLNPVVDLVARAASIEQLEDLQASGANRVVQPEIEAGLEIARQALLHMTLLPTQIDELTDALRKETYRSEETAESLMG